MKKKKNNDAQLRRAIKFANRDYPKTPITPAYAAKLFVRGTQIPKSYLLENPQGIELVKCLMALLALKRLIRKHER